MEDELGFVPRAKLKRTLRDLERDPDSGKALTRGLTGCRSVRVVGSENRLVYRVRGTGPDAQVEVLAIGRRRDSAVYGVAERRHRT